MSPTPRHSTHKAPILTPVMERCPDVAWSGCWQGGACPLGPLCLARELCASYGWLKIVLDCPTALESCLRLPMKGHENLRASHLFPMGTGNDPRSPLLFPPM